MKIAQRQTAIANFYEHVIPNLATSQNSRVMAVIKPGKDYSLCELMALTNANKQLPPIDKSSMSRVVNNLRAAERIEAVPENLERKCTFSGVRVTPSRLPVKQAELFPGLVVA